MFRLDRRGGKSTFFVRTLQAIESTIVYVFMDLDATGNFLDHIDKIRLSCYVGSNDSLSSLPNDLCDI